MEKGRIDQLLKYKSDLRKKNEILLNTCCM